MLGLKITVARKCKEIRQSAGITVRDWADSLALKPEQIMNFEKGITTIPTLVLVEYVKLKEKNDKKR